SICWRSISSSSGLRGRPCRNSTGILLLHLAAGGTACSPVSTGIGVEDPGHQEHREPSTRLPTDASEMTVERADIDRPACSATGTIHVVPGCSGGDGAPDRWRPQGRSFSVPALDDVEGGLLGSFIGRMGGFVRRTLLLEIGDARGFAVRVIVGHGAASIGRRFVARNGGTIIWVPQTWSGFGIAPPLT